MVSPALWCSRGGEGLSAATELFPVSQSAFGDAGPPHRPLVV